MDRANAEQTMEAEDKFRVRSHVASPLSRHIHPMTSAGQAQFESLDFEGKVSTFLGVPPKCVPLFCFEVLQNVDA